MSAIYQQEESTPFISMSGRQIIGAIIVGAGVGLLTWGLALLFDAYIFKTLFCHDPASLQCVSSFQYASAFANIVAAGVGVFSLVKLQVFRPLLIGICVVVSLWGLGNMLTQVSRPLSALALIGVSMLAYVLFTWVARIRSFGMSLITMVVLIVIVRLVLNS